jgi:peptide deformylase
MTYDIITVPNPILRIKAEKTVTDKEIQEIRESGAAQKMVKTLHSIRNSVGLAAPQIGMTMRFFLFLHDKVPVFCFNPKITETNGNKTESMEGCLSCLENVAVERNSDIKVTYKNLFGKEISEDLEPMDSIIFQHELDHLNGILITDYKK